MGSGVVGQMQRQGWKKRDMGPFPKSKSYTALPPSLITVTVYSSLYGHLPHSQSQISHGHGIVGTTVAHHTEGLL